MHVDRYQPAGVCLCGALLIVHMYSRLGRRRSCCSKLMLSVWHLRWTLLSGQSMGWLRHYDPIHPWCIRSSITISGYTSRRVSSIPEFPPNNNFNQPLPTSTYLQHLTATATITRPHHINTSMYPYLHLDASAPQHLHNVYSDIPHRNAPIPKSFRIRKRKPWWMFSFWVHVRRVAFNKTW